MYVTREKIRELVEDLEWVTPRNLCILDLGRFEPKKEAVYRSELNKMTVTREQRLKKLKNNHGDAVFAKPATTLKRLKDFGIIHDKCLRDCLCRFMRETGKNVLIKHKFADAFFDDIYFEFDNGTEDEEQLRDKLKRYYSGEGEMQAIFWFRHREGKEHLEVDRLEKFLKIGNEVIVGKPRRILANIYSDYLDSGRLFDLKGRLTRY